MDDSQETARSGEINQALPGERPPRTGDVRVLNPQNRVPLSLPLPFEEWLVKEAHEPEDVNAGGDHAWGQRPRQPSRQRRP